MTGSSLPHVHALPSGTCLNQTYLIQDVLGQGGFGITYRGILADTGNVVAIKEYFPPSLAVRSRQEGDFTLSPYPEKNKDVFDQGRVRFLNEAAILRSFQDLECIVSVYDFFEENGTAYLVMEYIEGLTLRQYINENGTLTFPEISELILPVVHSLAEIHEKGLIHRDISPDNLIIGTDNQLHLIDFGATSQQSKTAAQNTVILKAGYAPPEQYISGSRIGAWVDVYALCATLYFALTGSAPAEAIHRLDSDSPEPLSGLNHLLFWQRAILEKGLQLRPADRFQTMHALGSALNGTMDADKDRTVLRPAPTKKDRRRMRNMHRFSSRSLFVTVTGALLVILAGSVFFLWNTDQTPSGSSVPSSVPSVHTEAAHTTQPAASPAATAGTKLLTMPDLTGLSLKQAKKKIKKLDSSIRIKTTYSYSKTIPAGKVLTQSIAKGVSFSQKQLASVSLTISKGAKPSSAPAATATPKPSKKPTSDSQYHVREDDDLSSIPLD